MRWLCGEWPAVGSVWEDDDGSAWIVRSHRPHSIEISLTWDGPIPQPSEHCYPRLFWLIYGARLVRSGEPA